MKKKICALISLAAVMMLSSCGGNTPTYSTCATITITGGSEGKVYAPDEVTLTESFHSVEEKLHYNTQVMPSVGDVHLLVIPVLVPGYETIDLDGDGTDDKEQVRADLNEAFFGGDKVAYESVAGFYEKSSYGKLKLQGTVTEWFDLSTSDLGYTSAASIDLNETYEVVRAAVNWAKAQGIDMRDYDSDSDGYIDGVWCIYSCPNYSNGGPYTDYNNYWAYTTWGNQTSSDGNEAPSVDSPVYNLFGWAGYDFMYEGYGKDQIDTHTYIHETGHFLGLNDYYSDNGSYNPIGKVDMMDSNIIDHNSFSKMLLGWTKPYLVTGNATIDLYAMANENSCIVIPDDSYQSDSGEFDPFGEYIVVELYTNDALSYKDSRQALSDRPLAMNSAGVRIYHVDKRKFYVDISDVFNVTVKEYEGEKLDASHRLILPLSNGRGIDVYNTVFHLDTSVNLYDEIRLIEANGTDSFSNGGYQKDKSLFRQGDSFSMEDYGKNFFINEDRFDNGNTFSYRISIGEIR